jgi:hypothetical protein
MKITTRLAFLALTFVAAAGYSSHLGRKVWSPQVFAWRNPLKLQPIIEEQSDCPLMVVNTRFYSFMSIGSSIGSVLKIDVKNISSKPIHSFSVSYYSPDPLDTSGAGIQPEKLLQPGQVQSIGDSSRGKERVEFSVDFVQFADGDVWYSDPPSAAVKPEGVKAGAEASTEHLRRILESKGAEAVMNLLPRIRADVDYPDFSTREAFGDSGFYCGITNTEVRVQYAYQEGGLSEVEDLLRQNYN